MGLPEGSKSRPLARLTDERLDCLIGNLLRVGVIAAAVVVLLGGVAYLAQHAAQRADYRVFAGEPAALRSVPGVVRSALSLESRGVIQLGLLILVATPIARVIMSLAAFALQREPIYVVVTAVVLGILLFGLVGGRV